MTRLPNASNCSGESQTSLTRSWPSERNQRLRVLAVVPFDEEDESPFVGLLQVEAA